MIESHLQRRHALPAALSGDVITTKLKLGDPHGGAYAECGVGRALQQYPHDPPTAPEAGRHSAVMPRRSRWLIEALALGWPSRTRTTSRWPWKDAPINGVLPSGEAMVGSAPLFTSSLTEGARPSRLAVHRAVSPHLFRSSTAAPWSSSHRATPR
jgi:hypothetical protein